MLHIAATQSIFTQSLQNTHRLSFSTFHKADTLMGVHPSGSLPQSWVQSHWSLGAISRLVESILAYLTSLSRTLLWSLTFPRYGSAVKPAIVPSTLLAMAYLTSSTLVQEVWHEVLTSPHPLAFAGTSTEDLVPLWVVAVLWPTRRLLLRPQPLDCCRPAAGRIGLQRFCYAELT
jgi:hypothetical protein